MRYFLAKIIHQIVTGNNSNTQFDEQLRLIISRSGEDALEKARRIGLNEEEVFLNENRKPVQWKFIGVTELYEVSEEKDGAEVWSHISEQDYAEAFVEGIRRKADALQLRHNLHFLPSM